MVLVATLTFGLVAGRLSLPATAYALSCAGSTGSHFAGNQSNHTSAVRGAKAQIEYVNESLCTTAGGNDFSSYWSAVVGYDAGDTGHEDIYQISVDKCVGSLACAPTSPSNKAYYFWAYGRQASSACGADVGPIPNFIANANTSTHTYKVVREYLTGVGFFYNLYIDSTGYQTWFKTESSLNDCWHGVDGAQFYNEVLDPHAESGGPTANHQSWNQVYWYTGSAWTAVTGASGSNCQAHDYASQKCVWNSVDPSVWASWDTNY